MDRKYNVSAGSNIKVYEYGQEDSEFAEQLKFKLKDLTSLQKFYLFKMKRGWFSFKYFI